MAPVTAETAQQLVENAPARFEIGTKLLTLAFGGIYLAATTVVHKPLLVWEVEGGYARYYIPVKSLHHSIRKQIISDHPDDSNGINEEQATSIQSIDVVTSKSKDSKAVVERITIASKSTSWIRFLEGPFKDFIRFEKEDLDQWFENGAIFVSIKNPYKRIDTKTVSQHIVVKVKGEVVAETNAATLLNETGQPAVYYLPATSIKRWAGIEKSELRTACPYKGEAWYLSLTIKDERHENLIWYYPYPTHESAGIEGLIGFIRKAGVEISVDDTVI